MAEDLPNNNKGNIDPTLLAILCCPETKQPVSLLDDDTLTKINRHIGEGQVKNKGGHVVKELIDGGLLRADQSLMYPIREHIPIMLIEEGITMDQVL